MIIGCVNLCLKLQRHKFKLIVRIINNKITVGCRYSLDIGKKCKNFEGETFGKRNILKVNVEGFNTKLFRYICKLRNFISLILKRRFQTPKAHPVKV
jgi:hypothetical protein